MPRTLGYIETLEWRPDRGFWCFGPDGLASDIGVFIWWLGVENLVIYSFGFFLVPFAAVLAISNLVYWIRKREYLSRIFDGYLAAVPIIWMVLVVLVPVGRSPANLFELSALGSIAALTVVARHSSAPHVWSSQSKIGAFGMCCMTVCFWAFFPAL